MSVIVDTSAAVLCTPGELVICCSAFVSFFGKSNWTVYLLGSLLSCILFQLPASEEGSEVKNCVLFSTKTNISGQECLDAAWQSLVEISGNLET